MARLHRQLVFVTVFAFLLSDPAFAADDNHAELQQKLGQLKALLDAKGGDLNAEQKELLSKLGDLDQYADSTSGTEQGEAKQREGDDVAELGASPELNEILSTCVTLSMSHFGSRHRSTTMGSLKRLAEGDLPPSSAATLNKFWRMVAVCITEITEDDIAQSKSGEVAALPPSWVAKASDKSSKELVAGLDLQMWVGLQGIASAVLEKTAKEEL